MKRRLLVLALLLLGAWGCTQLIGVTDVPDAGGDGGDEGGGPGGE